MSIKKIGLLGNGKMSSEIYKWLIDTDYELILWGRRLEAVESLKEELLKKLVRRAKKNDESGKAAELRLSQLSFTTEHEKLSDVDIIIESISEQYHSKIEIFKLFDKIVKKDCIFATNTSSLSPSSIAKHTSRPDKFVALHFFSPVSLVRFVEVLGSTSTPKEVIEEVSDFVRTIKKHPLNVKKEAAGYIVNKILAAYYHEGIEMVGEGYYTPFEIDQIGKKFALMGPCESIDRVGVDVIVNSYTSCDESWGTPNYVQKHSRGEWPMPQFYQVLFDDGRLGLKTSIGFYKYESNKQIEDNDYIKHAYPRIKNYKSVPHYDEVVAEKRLWASVLLEAVRMLEDGVGEEYDIDLSIKEILGLEKGPFQYIKEVGAESVKKYIAPLEEAYGARFQLYGILR